MVSNNTHLSIVLDEILDDINLNTIDVLFRCYLWMAFMGINYELSTSVSVNDVNFDDMVINFCGKSYEMYRESIPSFKRSVSLKEFTYINSNYKIGAITRSRIDGNMLLRGTKSNLSPPYFKTELSRKLSASDTVYKRISYKRIKTSGMFYKMFMLESSGIKNWFDIICSEYDEDVYNKTSTMKDYIKWKDTFYR